MYTFKILGVALLITCTFANNIGYSHTEPEAKPETKRAFARDCDSGYSLTCLKLDIVSFVEKMSETEDYTIMPGISVVKEAQVNDSKTADIVAELARSFPNDADKRLDAFLLQKLSGYLSSHTLRLKLLDSAAVEEARDAFSGRKGDGGGFGGGGGGGGGGGKKGGMGGIMMMAMMMKGTMMSIGLGALALLAGKALMTAMMALLLSAIVALKSLAGGGGKSTTYEIISKPIYSQSHSQSSSHEDIHGHGGGGGGGGHSGYGGYGRSLNFALPEHLKN